MMTEDRYHRRLPKRLLTTEYYKLDVMAFKRAGTFKNGVQGSLRFDDCDNPRFFFKYENGALTLRYSEIAGDMQNSAPISNISIRNSPYRFGGSRPYFICSNHNCNTSASFLYGFKATFQCRKCLNLAYPSQNETTIARGYIKQYKLLINGCPIQSIG